MDTRTISAGDVDLAIAEAGAGGRPFLLMHGFTGAKEDFTEWLDLLAAQGWHVVAPDHRGHGASSKPASDEAYSTSILADDALALTDALGWSTFVLLGHSMGGFVAQTMALNAPERLDALVLMDTAHGPLEGINPDEVELAKAVVRDVGMAGLLELLEQRGSPLETEANKRVSAERPGYVEFGNRKFLATSPHLYAALLSEMISQQDRLAELAGLPAQLPTLVIVGDQDAPFIGPSKRMADTIPAATLAVVADAGHSPQFENPDQWWLVLSTFLEGIEHPAH